MKDGFFRVGVATPEIQVANCEYNSNIIIQIVYDAAKKGAGAVVFPELCITGYTCGDLFLQRLLLEQAARALFRIAEETKELDCVIFVGLPVAVGPELYNCAAVLCGGRVLGLVPKTNIPNYSEFYEQRHFSKGPDLEEIELNGQTIPLGTHLLFACRNLPELIFGAEICEDLWVACPPSSGLAAAGATVIANLSASDEIIGKAAYRRQLVCSQSGRTVSAYLYADAGEGESTTDLVFSGHNLIAENGILLAESRHFSNGVTLADIDLQRLSGERRRTTTCRTENADRYRKVFFDLRLRELTLIRKISPYPFVPSGEEDLEQRCEEILGLQVAGLRKRLSHTRCRTAVIGLSGGLDSTLALLVTVRAFDFLGLDRRGILAVTMPCFGTTARTKGNAELLADSLGVSFQEISIEKAVTVHLSDIGHDLETLDVTYENAQARERTQVLMDLANRSGGMVIGTGDLSELALGWATYNGDHMSMYGVNASIPKTLIRYLVKYEASKAGDVLARVLEDILETPVSPELLPPKDGVISQKTENIVGPYELHDFFLYYILRFGFTPSKIFRMACCAFCGTYGAGEILKWMKNFYRRFFSQQFKRSCLPDGPKVGTVSLSPRGDWRMPSDASPSLWLEELEGLEKQLEN